MGSGSGPGLQRRVSRHHGGQAPGRHGSANRGVLAGGVEVQSAHLQACLAGKVGTLEDQLFPITRHGSLEEAYFTLCYSPVRDETSRIAGMLITVLETTAKVQAAKERDKSDAALRLSEGRLRLALSGANGVGIWDCDIVQDRFYADAKFAAVYGVDSELAASGTPLASFTKSTYPEDVYRVAQSIARTVREGGQYAEEHRLLQKDGSICWVIAKGHLLSSASGTPLDFSGVATEIIVQKRQNRLYGSLKAGRCGSSRVQHRARDQQPSRIRDEPDLSGTDWSSRVAGRRERMPGPQNESCGACR